MGYIYAFRNDYHSDDVYKIGSTDDIEARLKQANATDTWKVGEFKCVLKVKTVNHRKKEAQLHQLIKDRKCPGNAREFFKINLEQINCFFKLISNEEHMEEVEEAPKPKYKPKWEPQLNVIQKQEADFKRFFDECIVRDDSAAEFMDWKDVWSKYTEWHSIDECTFRSKAPRTTVLRWINQRVEVPCSTYEGRMGEENPKATPYGKWARYSLKQCEIFDDIELSSWNDLDQNN